MSTADWDPWNYRESVNREQTATGLVGYKVHATDGDIGKVDESNDEVGSAQIVVDTGPWIFGRKVILPAGVIERIDDADEKVYVSVTKDQIKASPEFDDTTRNDPAYRDTLGNYYGDYYNKRTDDDPLI